MAVASIDLNADLAEECGGDEDIFPLLSSANICCGAHAGGPEAMRNAVSMAVQYGVRIGAHIGYPARENFGRTPMDLPVEALWQSITDQLHLLARICDAASTAVTYVKPHGALYHRVGSGAAEAEVLAEAVAAFDTGLHLLVPNTPVIIGAAGAAGLECRFEYFADRGYNADGTLVDRRQDGAMLTDPDEIVGRALTWLDTGYVRCIEGHDIRVDASSICLHGDEPDAIASARALRSALDQRGYAVRSWLVP